ncbi:MAG: hypothetical protein ACR2LS_08185 [Thermomicrobiales bacterium]
MLDLYHASREDLIALVVAHGDALAAWGGDRGRAGDAADRDRPVDRFRGES